MPDFTITAPAKITIIDASGTSTITINAPVVPPIIPPVTPPVDVVGRQQPYVARAGSNDWIIRADQSRLDINATGTILFDSAPIPGSDHSYAVGYDPTTNSTYRQTSATAAWMSWGGSMTDPADWHTPSPPWVVPTTPPVTPPVVPPTTGSLRDRTVTWMKGLSSQGKVMFGQYCDTATVGLADAIAFTSVTGKHVAMQGDGFWPFWPTKENAGGAGRSVAQVVADAVAQYKAGGFPYIQSSFPSPNGGDMYGTCDPVQATTPGSAQYNKLFTFYKQELDGLLAMKQQGILALPYRCLFENRWNFWWGFSGGSGWTPPLWIKLWQQHHDYLTQNGCDHLIWILSQYINPADGFNKGDTWPGDKYVHLNGEDVYTDYSTQYKNLKDGETAAHPNHPWGMMEWGSGSPSQGNPNFDMRGLIADLKGGMKGAMMVQAWCGSQGQYAWRLANMKFLNEAMADPIVLLRENLNRPT